MWRRDVMCSWQICSPWRCTLPRVTSCSWTAACHRQLKPSVLLGRLSTSVMSRWDAVQPAHDWAGEFSCWETTSHSLRWTGQRESTTTAITTVQSTTQRWTRRRHTSTYSVSTHVDYLFTASTSSIKQYCHFDCILCEAKNMIFERLKICRQHFTYLLCVHFS